MLYSQIFTKTQKKSKTLDSVNATLLMKGGFVDQEMAGVYTFLPLGWRVLKKIENIIREEMDTIGTELFMPSLSLKETWEKSGRLNTVDILMKASAANDGSLKKNNAEYVLNATHEDVITPMAKKFRYSYKDLPFAVYQIQTKFRNEERPKSGLLRCREFRMKDLYSFHADEKDLNKFYEKAKEVYTKIFKRLGLSADTIIALASGGDFTEEYSHEFQTRCESGEDIIFYDKKLDIGYNREVAPCMAVQTKEKNIEKALPMKEVKGEGIIGVEELCKFLEIPLEKTTKTILFEDDKQKVYATCVRGDYDINEYKLRKILGVKKLILADERTVKKVTKAEVGYAGPLNLPQSVKILFDDSMKGRVNFECGANRTNYHTINVNFGRDLDEPKEYVDLKIAKEGDYHPNTKKLYEVFRACEVGNIFPLNTKFSDAFHYQYTDEDGRGKPVFMASYGIGSSRVMGVLVEKFHDERGIVWPKQVAPFRVHLIAIGKNEQIYKNADETYAQMESIGIETFYDNRMDISAGEKFADADLFGIPFRVVCSEKTGSNVEVKARNEKNVQILSIKEALKLFKD